ncbi:MAG: ABC transporter substrate-binding protein, partial [Candidatus Lokiarchaeota archaeon]|nr:ABC transporter substrate-binding protein [Candidatus Lokiarchaeota archaeon]
MEKKGQIAVGLIAIIAIAAIGGGIAFVMLTEEPGAGETSLIMGTMYGPVDLDPQVAWDSASIDAIDQVCEGLFAYDLTDPDLALIPALALSGTWNPAGTEFTVILRQGVKFHDGADFNADAVIFTWNRMSWALNTTGTNTDVVTQVAELYEFPDGTPIVASITKNSDYSITFNLAGPYIPFQSLLAFSASYILSPDSTPATTYIDTASGDIVGTGPFVYDGYEAGVEVTFHKFNGYWQGAAQIDKLVFSVITDANARNAALLSGDIDYLPDPLDSILGVFNLTAGIDLYYVGQSLVTQYLGMNNVLLNTTWREAIAYAIDYDYITDTLREGNAVKMESPIPEGIIYANWTFDEAELDLAYARGILQSMGHGVGLNVTVDSSDEMTWQGSTFFTVNYTYNIGNSFREDVLVLLQDNLGKIGIVVEDAGMTWGNFIYRLYEIGGLHRNMLQLYWIGWGPDYNDPSNFINPLFTNRSVASNGAQYNGYAAAIEAGRDPMDINDNVQLLMEAGLSETDPVAREALYDRIQELLIEEDHPWVWGYVS